MKLKSALLIIISAALLATSAKAVLYNDLDVFNTVLSTAPGGTSSLSNYFQISTQDDDNINDLVGYAPGQQIYSAIAAFSFVDDGWLLGDSAAETVSINLGSGAFVTNEWSFVFANGLSGSAMLDLGADGELAYKIVATTGDFKVLRASLAVIAGVPDGGTTAVLLGMGFLGICAVQRKFALAR